MIANHFGHDIDLSYLRARYSVSLRGSSLGQLLGLAKDIGLNSRALRLELEKLDKLRMPALLHWDMSHFVVLAGFRRGRFEILDPTRGRRSMTPGEVSDHFTGVAVEFSKAADFSRIENRQKLSLRAMTGAVNGIGAAFAQIAALALCLEVTTVLLPLFVQLVLDQVLVTEDTDLLTLLGVGFLLVALFRSALTAARGWQLARLSAAVSMQWSTNLFGHLLRLPLSWFEKRNIGDVLSRLGSADEIQRTLTTQFIEAVLDGAMSAVALALCFYFSGTIGAIAAGMFVCYVVFRSLIFGAMARANQEQITFQARQQGEMIETMRGILTVKLGNKEQSRLSRYANATVSAVNRQLIAQRFSVAHASVSGLILASGRIVLIWVGASQAISGELTAGAIVAVAAYADQFLLRATALVDKLSDFRLLGVHLERLADVAMAETETAEPKAFRDNLSDTRLEVRDVGFRYSDADPWILRNCSFVIDSGRSLAIAGPSGAGKTTLAKLLLGLLKPSEGQVLFAGVPIEDLGRGAYRDMIGAVMQDDQLFSGTLAENIAFFDADADMGRIRSAAETASIRSDIEAMPMGFLTTAGDMGSTLSGGQKQRVLLARALYRAPALLVLDEATSHLDPQRESAVNQTVKDMRITRAIIAHREETIRSADAVVELRRLPGLDGFTCSPVH